MTVRTQAPASHIGWFEAAADCTVRILMLVAWAVMVGGYGLTLLALSGTIALADDPKNEARAIGRAGTAQAGAIARTTPSAVTVPGFAGTDLPERRLDGARLESAARQRLADPDDPGGGAGRAVIAGRNTRPDRPVATSDPGVRRARSIEASPNSVAHGARGLASGSADDCDAEVDGADRGGECGSVSYCVGGGCESVNAEGNTGFARSAAMLKMVVEMGGDEFDRNNLRFFQGDKRSCEIKFAGLANCCKNSGLLVGLANCSSEEKELAKERNAGNTHYLGRRCAKRVLGVCVKRERSWCVFGSMLGRILHQQARPQLGLGWGSCRGFTVAEIRRIDFDRLDLSEFTDNLMDGSREPAVELPDRDDTEDDMRDRVRELTGGSP